MAAAAPGAAAPGGAPRPPPGPPPLAAGPRPPPGAPPSAVAPGRAEEARLAAGAQPVAKGPPLAGAPMQMRQVPSPPPPPLQQQQLRQDYAPAPEPQTQAHPSPRPPAPPLAGAQPPPPQMLASPSALGASSSVSPRPAPMAMQRSSEAEAAVNAAKAEAAASARGDAAASAGVPFLALSMAVAPQCARAHASGAVPLGAVFAPFARGAEAPPVARGRGRPQRCGACGAAESAYSHASLQAGRWVCVFCGSENAVEGGASTQTDAAALGNVVDFVRGQAAADSSARLPATVFVVDTSADPEDVANMRAAITEAIGAMPDDARIGIVSAGASVRVYDMAATVMASADVLSGRTSPSREAMRALLIGAAVPVAPLRECREAALTATAALRCDSSAGVRAGADKAARGRAFIPTSERDRCVVTGVEVALGIIDGTDVAQMRPQQIRANSSGLYQGSKPTSSGGHVVLITTGPVTLGPGALPRDASHPLFLSECRAAARHVAALGDAAARQGAVIDVIAAGGTPIDVQHCLPMTERSGGAMQLVEELAAPLASTLRAGLLRTRATRSHVKCEIRVSRPLVVSRIMGAVYASKSGGDGDGDGELATGGGKGEAVHVALRVADSSAGIGVLYRLDEDVTSDYVFVQCVAQYVEVSTGDIRTRVVTRRLRTTASASMVAKGLNAEVAGLLAAKRALLTADSSSDANETSTYAGASVGARAKVFTASGDVACDELADRLVAAAGEMGAACGAPGTLPPALVPLAMRFYHFARGTAAAGGAPHPDEVALARSRLRTSGLDTSCYIMPRCWMVVPGAETEELVDVLPTNLVLMSNACVVLDAGSHTVVWVGASVSPDENAGVIDRCNAFATKLVTGRFPAPTLLTVREHSSASRQVLARVAPAHHDPAPMQDNACAYVRTMLPGQRAELMRKLATIPTDELGFSDWLQELMEEV